MFIHPTHNECAVPQHSWRWFIQMHRRSPFCVDKAATNHRRITNSNGNPEAIMSHRCLHVGVQWTTNHNNCCENPSCAVPKRGLTKRWIKPVLGSYFGNHHSPKKFRYLKWRNPHRHISCMDTAYVRENPPPTYPKISFRKPSILSA